MSAAFTKLVNALIVRFLVSFVSSLVSGPGTDANPPAEYVVRFSLHPATCFASPYEILNACGWSLNFESVAIQQRTHYHQRVKSLRSEERAGGMGRRQTTAESAKSR